MKKNILFLVVMLAVILSGCGKKDAEDNNVDKNIKVMGVSMEEVSKVEKYSSGEVTEIPKDSEELKGFIKSVEENEKSAGMIDGGLGVDMFAVGKGNYAEFSEKENCEVYIINLQEKQHIVYGKYDSKETNIAAIFIVPKKNYFGLVIEGDNKESVDYATFANVDKKMFE